MPEPPRELLIPETPHSTEDNQLRIYRERYLEYLQYKYGALIEETRASIRPKTFSQEESILYLIPPPEELHDALFAAALANGKGKGIFSSEYIYKLTNEHGEHCSRFSNKEIVVGTMIEYLDGLLREWENNTLVLADLLNPFEQAGRILLIRSPQTFPLLSSTKEGIQIMIELLKKSPYYYKNIKSSDRKGSINGIIHGDKHLRDTMDGMFKDVGRYRWLKELSSEGGEFKQFLDNLHRVNLTIEIQPRVKGEVVIKHIQNAAINQYLPYIFQTALSQYADPPSILSSISEPFGFPEMEDFIEQIKQRMKLEFPTDDSLADIPNFYLSSTD